MGKRADEEQNLFRPIVSSIVIFYVMYQAHLFTGDYRKIGVHICIFLLWAATFMLPNEWWNIQRLMLVTVVISTLSMLALIYSNSVLDIYMMFILILKSPQLLKFPGYLYYSAAILAEMMVLIALFGHLQLLHFFSIALFFVGVTLSVKARISRRKAYELSKKHLQELEHAHKELQEAAVTSMHYAVLGERARIAQDIHDAVGHSLTTLIVQLQALRYMIENNSDQAVQSVDKMLEVAREGLAGIRNSVHALAEDKSSLGIAPLKALVSKLAATTSLKYCFSSDTDSLPTSISAVMFKVLQEAATNTLKHAEAATMEIHIGISDYNYLFSIKDDGKLTTGDKITEGFGLKGIRERVREIGGKTYFTTRVPHGFEITIEIPAGGQDF